MVEALISTSNVERQNLTMRMHKRRRSTRVINGLGMRTETHMHAVPLRFVYCNFVKVHQTSMVAPAREPGLTDRLWGISLERRSCARRDINLDSRNRR